MGIQTGQTRIVLASASPRRAQLLAQLGIFHEVEPANVDERRRKGEAPVAYVERMAREKAAAVARRAPQALVLGADTAVVAGDEVLGKPANAEEARQMLARLSGRSHRVLTGVAVDGAARAVSSVETQVTFRTLCEAEIAWYVGTGEPLDKAGAYAIQGAGGAFVVRVEGSVSNVIGLPLAETLALLAGAGLRWPPGAP